MAEIVWTETALTDIESIAEYISSDSVFYARQFVKQIFTSTLKLEKFLEIGRIVPELPAYTYRQILFKKYRIIYRVSLDTVYIISVHHSARLLNNNEHLKAFLSNRITPC